MTIEKLTIRFHRPWAVWHKNWKKKGYLCRWNVCFGFLWICLALRRSGVPPPPEPLKIAPLRTA
jgi:hypothetical protein